MVETHISLSVNRLLNEDTYAIPLYQRNFAWTYDEIEQLLNDVADALILSIILCKHSSRVEEC